jgi:hypothetical protein
VLDKTVRFVEDGSMCCEKGGIYLSLEVRLRWDVRCFPSFGRGKARLWTAAVDLACGVGGRGSRIDVLPHPREPDSFFIQTDAQSSNCVTIRYLEHKSATAL